MEEAAVAEGVVKKAATPGYDCFRTPTVVGAIFRLMVHRGAVRVVLAAGVESVVVVGPRTR